MLKPDSTLSLRLVKIIYLLTFGLFILFSSVTFFVAFSLEDAMFDQQLKQASIDLKNKLSLPSHIIQKANLDEYQLTHVKNSLTTEYAKKELSGEFAYAGRHYHYLGVQDFWLVIDVTETGFVVRGLTDILSILLVVFLLSLTLSYFIAKKLSQHALKPFHKLTSLIEGDESKLEVNSELVSDIVEVDVKALVEKFEKTLLEKRKLIQEQMIFNQSVSHEIRTPLQVMAHSLELLEKKDPLISENKSIKRLDKSIKRIKRITNALLWLTTKDECKEITDVTRSIKQTVDDCCELISAHKLSIEVITESKLFLKIPSSVIELISYNLINNAIHHAASIQGTKKLSIRISHNKIAFLNACLVSENEDSQGFGLGLKIIEKLARRFNLTYLVAQSATEFSVELTTNER